MNRALELLTTRQRDLLAEWFPHMVVEEDLSWGLVETRVLQVLSNEDRFVVKAAPPGDKHLARELRAHHDWLSPWIAQARAPRLVHWDFEASILATQFVPGHLVLGTTVANDPVAYQQAGELLRLLHGQPSVLDPEYEGRANASTRRWLDGPHRIETDTSEELKSMLEAWPTPAAVLVPTHGDWQPRNWLWHDGLLTPIDFGRAALRPAMTDLARLEAQDFRREPLLEKAFFKGYGVDPRATDAWQRVRIREAIGTAAWAFVHKDEAFEQQGFAMLAKALSDYRASRS